MGNRADGGPAYPDLNWERDLVSGNPAYYTNEGMSLRDWFAGHALTGLLANTHFARIGTMRKSLMRLPIL